MKIIVLGAGAWGTAVAINAAAGTGGAGPHAVTLWARDAAQAATMQAERHNARYLPGIPFPSLLQVQSGDVALLASAADLVVVATPMSGLRAMLHTLRDCRVPVAWLCKGFEAPVGNAFGLMGHEICAQVAPGLQAGALSGPSFAQEVAKGQPTALVAASEHAAVRDVLVAAFHGPTLRVYASDDLVGVEVGGAVKNLLAIATGLCDGLNLGLNARAALITRGIAEMTRLGLAGLGDVVLTATGSLSRNRKVGLLLAEGKTLQQAVDSLGHVAEGVYCARTVVQRAGVLGVEMPISEAVVALLDGRTTPGQAVQALMGRDPVAEGL